MASQPLEVIDTWSILEPCVSARILPATTHLEISNALTNEGEAVLDFGRCEGGTPVFIVESAVSSEGLDEIPFRVTYSETREGIDHDTGDGPFFLFSNAMDAYRSNSHIARAGLSDQTIKSRFVQASQRYLKVVLTAPKTTIVFSTIGFERVRPEIHVKAKFQCSNATLNSIWKNGVRTVDMCTVSQGQTKPAWDSTPQGARVYGGHWAPCRQGTRWADKTVTFETKVERLGASWAVHMVANGLIFCLDVETRTLEAHLGLSNYSGTFPSRKMGSWSLPPCLDTSDWMRIVTITTGDEVTVSIQDQAVAYLSGVQVQPLLGGAGLNTGSVAFGGPAEWASLLRGLTIVDGGGKVCYSNTLLDKDAERTYADFQVGTNQLACLIDGAKRDRTCFGGDAFVTGRSIAYSTGDLETWRGSLQLLMSHQTPEGLLGNLCPIQAPEHCGEDEPPTYAFYSLTYALLLIVSVKDYWYHSGDDAFVQTFLPKMHKQLWLTAQYLNRDGLVEAPPSLSMTWFPMGGPVFGVSAGINLAYLNALRALELMASSVQVKSKYAEAASELEQSLVRTLWNEEAGILRFSDSAPADGIAQDTFAYASTLGVLPEHSNIVKNLYSDGDLLPAAFRGLGHWDQFGVSSPYASGFALEALLAKSEHTKALELLLRVWGTMADESSPNYSGAHWEAMDRNGKPFNHDVSLAHGWSTWPVFLMPRYLAGIYPIEPGWGKVAVEPVLADLEQVSYSIETARGLFSVAITTDGTRSNGTIELILPKGTVGIVSLPESWRLLGSGEILGRGEKVSVHFERS